MLFDNQGKFICEAKSDQTDLLQDFIHYYNNNGNTYMDICALQSEDHDLVLKIKKEFQN